MTNFMSPGFEPGIYCLKNDCLNHCTPWELANAYTEKLFCDYSKHQLQTVETDRLVCCYRFRSNAMITGVNWLKTILSYINCLATVASVTKWHFSSRYIAHSSQSAVLFSLFNKKQSQTIYKVADFSLPPQRCSKLQDC